MLRARSLLVLKLLEEVDEKLVAVVLHERVEVAFDQLAQIRTYNPLLGLAALAKNHRVEVVEVVGELPAVLLSFLALHLALKVFFEDKVVAQLVDRQ